MVAYNYDHSKTYLACERMPVDSNTLWINGDRGYIALNALLAAIEQNVQERLHNPFQDTNFLSNCFQTNPTTTIVATSQVYKLDEAIFQLAYGFCHLGNLKDCAFSTECIVSIDPYSAEEEHQQLLT